MNADKTPEEQLVDLVRREVAKIADAGRGSGATVDDPCRLGAMHSLLAPRTEKMLVSIIYGEENRDWFDAGRKYHKNGAICEQRIRIGATPPTKIAWAKPGEVCTMFFDISELTHEAPISDAVKELLMKGALQMPLSDTTLVSRFPLIEVRAKTAVEAARIIAGHLRAAEAQGWTLGPAEVLVDNWRNEYHLTKGNKKTVMQFDMRPCLLSDSPRNLIALTMLATQPKLEQGLREFERSRSVMDACAVAGMKLVEASSEQIQAIRSSSHGTRVPDIFFDRRDRITYWNQEALQKYSNQKVRLIGECSTIEVPARDVVNFLMIAKSSLGWNGAAHLFQPTQKGFTLTLQDAQTISRSDAAELSAVLSAFSQSHPDPANPLHKTVRLLAAQAAAGGFSIKCERAGPATTASKTSRTTTGAAYAAPSRAPLQAAGTPPPAVTGPPGGVARYRHNLRPIDLRRRIDMLNGLYAGCTRTRTLLLPLPDYLNAAAREAVEVPADTMGFVTKSNQLFLNADQVHATRDLQYAYIRSPEITILYGPTFADAVCYGFYRLVCNFVGKDEFPTEDDVIQHARNLKQWERDAGGFVLQDIKTTLHFMKEFGEGTPLESAVRNAQKKLRWRFIT